MLAIKQNGPNSARSTRPSSRALPSSCSLITLRCSCLNSSFDKRHAVSSSSATSSPPQPTTSGVCRRRPVSNKAALPTRELEPSENFEEKNFREWKRQVCACPGQLKPIPGHRHKLNKLAIIVSWL